MRSLSCNAWHRIQRPVNRSLTVRTFARFVSVGKLTHTFAAHIPLFLYPFLNTTSKTRPFEYLRLTSLGVIGALVKVSPCLTWDKTPRFLFAHPGVFLLSSAK